MVQALLAGRKTQTRRIFYVKDPSGKNHQIDSAEEEIIRFDDGSWNYRSVNSLSGPYPCPYGTIGDLLWVREEHYAYGWWEKNGQTKTGRQKWKFIRSDDPAFGIYFADTKPEGLRVRANSYRSHGWYKRIARFMPRKYCRIWLEITDMRVERLTNISDEDAVSEGISYSSSYVPQPPDGELPPLPWRNYMAGEAAAVLRPVDSYLTLWESINGDDWRSRDPWVWVISFKILSKIGKPIIS